MKKLRLTKLFLLVFIVMMSMTMLSCSSSDDDDVDGLIYNQTAYRVWVNFLGIKIDELSPGELLTEKALDKDMTYLFQVTFFDNAGNTLKVIDSTLIIDNNTGDQDINGQTCSWFISITGDSASSFRVLSAS